MRFPHPCFYAVLLGLWYPAALTAAPGDLLLSIPNPDPVAGEHFGSSVAALGPNIIVGAFGGGPSTRPYGRVLLLDGSTGDALLKINDPNPSAGLFGWDVAAAGDNIAVTENYAAYVFDGKTGEKLLTLPVIDAKPHIAYAGENLLVVNETAPRHQLFNGTTGELIRTIQFAAPTGSEYINSRAVTVLGDDFLVGEYLREAVVVYDSQTGDRLLTIPNPQPGTEFGHSVAAFGDDILVGAMNRAVNGIQGAGAVYLFDGQTGALKLTIPNPTPVSGEQFGIRVAGLHGHIAVALDQDRNPRSIELFDATNGAFVKAIVNPLNGAFGGGLGDALAVVNGNLVVGAPNATFGGASAAGAVFLFEGFPAPVPEPSTASLCIVSAICGFVFRRKNGRQVALAQLTQVHGNQLSF